MLICPVCNQQIMGKLENISGLFFYSFVFLTEFALSEIERDLQARTEHNRGDKSEKNLVNP